MKNNIRYKGNINHTSVIIFLNRDKETPIDGTLLGRTSSEGFVMLVVIAHSFLFFILLLFFILFCSSFISRLLYHVTSTPAWLLRPVKASLALSSTPTTFDSFSFSSTASATVLSGHFLPTWVFYLTLLHRHFTCVYQGLPGSR